MRFYPFRWRAATLKRNVSPNLVIALQHAKTVGAKVTGVVGRDGGYTAQVADACVIKPTVNPETITPHSEAFQAVCVAPAEVASETEGQPDRGRESAVK